MDSHGPISEADVLPVPREAAVLFAAGFGAAAEVLLRQQIQAAGGSDPAAWAMLLEILHRLDKKAAFDEMAEIYAATYALGERPTWGHAPRVESTGHFHLTGTIAKEEHLAGLAAHARTRTTVAVDMSQVDRIEFAFAPALCEALRIQQREGKRVILANIAELHAALLESFGLQNVVMLRRWTHQLPPRRGIAASKSPPVHSAAEPMPHRPPSGLSPGVF